MPDLKKTRLVQDSHNNPNTKKLERWAQELLDTGKRSNLINFKDTKISTVQVIAPSSEDFFHSCMRGGTFEIFDPKISDVLFEEENSDNPEGDGSDPENTEIRKKERLNRQDYLDLFAGRLKKRQILVYGQTPNPLVAVKNIAKRAKGIQEESGVDVVYLAFGFVEWNEKRESQVFFRAPLLLIHVNIITGAATEPIKLEISDDDVVVNPSFNYLINADYKLTLPEFKDDDTLSSYCGKVTRKVHSLGWKVNQDCKLGIFSFQKINMYEDLNQNRDQLQNNENVQVLLGSAVPDRSWDGGEIDHPTSRNPLIDLHTVVDADSSQIEAIEMAKSGRSFVLQGPPGTGKSQTITNIIAECLHDRKTVLFVSEKQAALNVVYDKLKKNRLGDFCLELHSHKANKKAVIDELNRTLDIPQSNVGRYVDKEIERKQQIQSKLDNYVCALHAKRDKINKSLYELYEAFIAYKKYSGVPFTLRNISEKGEDYLNDALSLLDRYAHSAHSVGQDYRRNCWYKFKNLDLSYDEKRDLKTDLEKLAIAFKRLKTATNLIETKFNVPKLDIRAAYQWQHVLYFAVNSEIVTPSLLTPNGVDDIRPVLTVLNELTTSTKSVLSQILADYTKDVLQLDGQELQTALRGKFKSFFSRLFNKEYKEFLANIQQYRKDSAKVDYHEALKLAGILTTYQPAVKEIEKIKPSINEHIDSCPDNINTNLNHINQELSKLKECLKTNATPLGTLTKLRLGDFKKIRPELKALAKELHSSIKPIAQNFQRIASYFEPKFLDLNDDYDLTAQKLALYVEQYDKLDTWASFMRLIHQIEEHDQLLDFVHFIIDKQISLEDITKKFQYLFYKEWINYLLYTDAELRDFSRIDQEELVRQFAEKDRWQLGISKKQIVSELSHARYDHEYRSVSHSATTIRREGQKKRRQLPIRKLLSGTWDLVKVIKPCFLMSPLSVSTFLDPALKFDTVIFDEASQIFPQDALGAIYRGRQVIVVGDSKQMPPSNFFTSSAVLDTYDDDGDDVADFESILDICGAAFRTKLLAWHYRSRYEQLIAFSNANFYGNRLITFPSSKIDREGIGVDYYNAGGTYDRTSQTNRAEAEYVVALIYKHIEEYPKRSLGVVAFSIKQQELIENLLTKRREENPRYERFFNANKPEPFFIKNLETVQGDERDTIIFSIAYAKDVNGSFLHNFGPLNRQGGERRLNVAVTRAKYNVKLVASIHYSDIDLSRARSEGARLLRSYLDYAENGKDALHRNITVPNDDQFDSEFENDVCEFLRSKGYAIDTQVGVSKYRIDLALRAPDSSDYILAVECDGATYHRARNARDRDRLRQEILENMGWKFYRIWSTDWFKNNEAAREDLIKAIEEALLDWRHAQENSSSETQSLEEDGEKEEDDESIKENEPLPERDLKPEYQEDEDEELEENTDTAQSGKTDQYLAFESFEIPIYSLKREEDLELHPQEESTRSPAQDNKGNIYKLKGNIFEYQPGVAEQFRIDAEQGDIQAQFNLAAAYFTGYGVPKNLNEAVKWFRKAAEQGLAEAQHNLGYCYSNGVGVSQNEEEGIKWLRKAVDQGLPQSQFSLGLCYFCGIGVPQDEKEAVRWFRRAAEQGFADAQFHLGCCYSNGTGIPQNKEETVKWYCKAAKQGHAEAQFSMGECYTEGFGVPRDYYVAAEWYRKAAEHGYSEAQYRLGASYYYGEGVEMDNDKAAKWFQKAAEQGHKEAKKALRMLSRF